MIAMLGGYEVLNGVFLCRSVDRQNTEGKLHDFGLIAQGRKAHAELLIHSSFKGWCLNISLSTSSLGEYYLLLLVERFL